MASFSSTYPTQRPVFMADFANGGRIDPRANFSRASTANVWDGSKHLSSENLITNSEDFSAWTANNTTPTANAVAAPDGTTTADTITGNSGTSSKYVLSNSISAAPYPVISVYVKAGTHNYIQIHNDQSSTHYANFDVTSGAGVAGSVGSNTTSTIQAVGSTGWYRCICRINTASMTSGIKVRLVDSASAAYGASSATTGTVHLWGAMATDIGDLTNIVAYQASTGQIHREYAPSLVSKSNNVGRFDYSTDGQSAGTSRGILIEGQVTNVLPFSTNGYNASNSFVWSSNAIGAKQNAAIAPSGNLEATLIHEDGTTNQHNFYRNITGTADKYTYSIYVKDAGVGSVGFRLLGPTSYGLKFNLSDGSTSAFYTAVEGYGFEDVGNGWKRIWVTQTLTATGWAMMIYLTRGGVNYAGDNYSGVLWYGAQIEQSSHPSSYTDTGTSGSTVTRAAESLSVATADIPGFSEGVGTIVCETGGVASSTATNQLAFGLRADSSNFFSAGVNNGGVTDASVRVYVKTSDGDQAFLNAGTATVGTGYKLACRFKLDNIAASMNGGAVVSDTSGKVPVGVDTLWVGQLAGNYYLNSSIKRVAIYNEALSDTNLQALTS